ncbi:hypothetical protein [Sorangium sp. So ce1389]|uniref:hypothetical protein n=1 Tax=Sorangium sp. So ce1389 TaxID=3133336 RepID=UPI003F60C7A0
MKKIARWALAFAAVVSVSGSAMALPEGVGYKVVMNTGMRKINVGQVAFTWLEQGASLFNDTCACAVKWCNDAGLPSCANMLVHEELTSYDQDCEYRALYPADATITIDPGYDNWGFDSRQQKKRVARLSAMQDGTNGVIKGVCQYGSVLSMAYSLTMTPTTHP